MNNKKYTDKAVEWMYNGLWGILVQWFKVPADPPALPVKAGVLLESFHPASGFLRYLKLWFWLVLALIDIALIVGWLIVLVSFPLIGMLIAIPVWVLAIVPDVIAYLAIHLRYDATWYVLSDRSMRIRRGIWIIREVTITFENIQNVKVRQGPVQRYYGIKDLIVETAGSGGDSSGGHHHHSNANQGVLEGIDNADELRDLLMDRIRNSTSTGLGDEKLTTDIVRGYTSTRISTGWKTDHIRLLHEIKDEVVALNL